MREMEQACPNVLILSNLLIDKTRYPLWINYEYLNNFSKINANFYFLISPEENACLIVIEVLLEYFFSSIIVFTYNFFCTNLSQKISKNIV